MFTERTERVKTHKGQISFPGGKWDNTDKSLEETALREAYEETGVIKDDVCILGKLSSVTTPSAFRIFPFVGALSRFNESVSEEEVNKIIFIPLKHLADYSNMEIKNRHMGMKLAINLPFFYYKDHVVWGATGIILKEFLDKCKSVFSKI
jgi:8-oxo-dGTP pyrophosphatase MutT (NUDIX family)